VVPGDRQAALARAPGGASSTQRCPVVSPNPRSLVGYNRAMDRVGSHDRAARRLVRHAALALALAAQLACMPKITERCWLVTNPTPPPALPAGFAELDALLLRRAADMTLASRHLDSSLVIVFRRDFAEMLLPALCDRLEQARKLAMAGRSAEAGRKYQALLVSSQVLAFAVAMQSMAQYADRGLQAGGQISFTQEKFADEAAPMLEAALGENPREIEHALSAHPEVFAGWATLLEEWPTRIADGAHKAKVAMVVVDIAFLVVATYQAAGAAAEIAAAGRPPMPPLPVFAMAGPAAAASATGLATVEMAEALQKLIALGALDSGVMIALSQSLTGSAAPSKPILPNALQMSAEPRAGVLPKPNVTDPKLRNLVDNLYKGTTNPNRVGAGTTADAVRAELATGQSTAGRFHLQKAEETVRGLQNWLQTHPDASYSDRLVAQSLLDDLLKALGRSP